MKVRQAVLLILLFVALLVLAYTKLRSTPVKPKPVLVNSSGSVGVIFTGNSFVRGSWTPKKSDVLGAEKQLPSFIKEAAQTNSAAGSILQRGLGSYRRQYLGLSDGGEKVLLINSFCDDMGHDWQKEMITVIDGGSCFFDGGSCFFNVEFSMHTKKLRRLYINANP